MSAGAEGMRRGAWLLASISCLAVALDACVSPPDESWVPQEVAVADTLEKIGHKAYSIMCNRFEDSIHDLYSSQLVVEAACTAHAIRTAPNATACAEVTAQCLDALPAPVEDELQSILEQAHCGSTGVSPLGCHSPVSELVACLGDLRDELDQLQQTVTCAAFGSPLRGDWWRIKPPASCLDLAQQCPAKLL
jgi:hypothetical protein